MKIISIRLRDHRNYDHKEILLSNALNIIIGPNGAGKTNILEAITLLSSGISHRTKSLTELIRHGQKNLFVELAFKTSKRSVEQKLSVGLDRLGKKRYLHNGVICKRTEDALGRIATVIFSPDDLSIIKGEPEARRVFMNEILSQTSGTYRHNRGRFVYALRQRNELLRKVRDRGADISKHEAELDAIDAVLASYATPVFLERAALVAELGVNAQTAFQKLIPHKELDVLYAPKLETESEGDGQAISGPLTELKDLEEMFKAALLCTRQQDVRVGTTSIGPHRDDIAVTINGRPAKSYASQGEQRSAVLALKFGELKYVEDHFDDRPILLLDDVLSELDIKRRGALLSKVREGYQTLITTTNVGYFSESELEQSNMIDLESLGATTDA